MLTRLFYQARSNSNQNLPISVAFGVNESVLHSEPEVWAWSLAAIEEKLIQRLEAPGLSGSLKEEARNSLTATSDDLGSGSSSSTTLNDQSSTVSNQSKDVKLPEDCIAVLAYSPSPYEDCRRSMKEMVEARMQQNEKVDWDFMEELLFCYLNLNEKKSYKFILSAFVDLIVVLRKNSNKIPAR